MTEEAMSEREGMMDRPLSTQAASAADISPFP